MKCAAMRLGEEFHDLDDVRYLLRYLNITSVEEALEIVTRYFELACPGELLLDVDDEPVVLGISAAVGGEGV
jgi:hypothetical protein